MGLQFDPAQSQQYVHYGDLSLGLNTEKSPHALLRGELSQLTNAWYSYGKSLSKRPGTTPLVTNTGQVGGGQGAQALVACRFGGQTWLVVQQGLNIFASAASGSVPPTTVWGDDWGTMIWGGGGVWMMIGQITGGVIAGAQMYDPKTGKDTLFLVNGVQQPFMWQGPGTTLVGVTTGKGFCPLNPNTGKPIHPAYVQTLGNNSHLFYSGDQSFPSAVFISDPFNPQSFTTPAMQANPYNFNAYQPAIIGQNDGVNGGDITALQTLGSVMLVFKQSAVYAMAQTQLLGDEAWMVYNISPSRGALSPRSVVPFDTFVGFLSIDGVYVCNTDTGSTQKISGNVPSFFDSTRFGIPALITDRTNALAGRVGNRYCIWIDTGDFGEWGQDWGSFDWSNGGVPTTGIWFDFDNQGDQGLPAAGEIDGMAPGGVASLAGPNDDGNLAWADGTVDRVGKFGVGFSDFGEPIRVTLSGKADLFEEQFGPGAFQMQKSFRKVWLHVSTLSTGVYNAPLQFAGLFGVDFSNVRPGSTQFPALSVAPFSGGWGSNWGSFDWTTTQFGPSGYAALCMPLQAASKGYVGQVTIQEESVYPWLLLGYAVELNEQQVSK